MTAVGHLHDHGPDPMSAGHGHVTPRPDGGKARCGGPALCCTCRAEEAARAPDLLEALKRSFERRIDDIRTHAESPYTPLEQPQRQEKTTR